MFYASPENQLKMTCAPSHKNHPFMANFTIVKLLLLIHFLIDCQTLTTSILYSNLDRYNIRIMFII